MIWRIRSAITSLITSFNSYCFSKKKAECFLVLSSFNVMFFKMSFFIIYYFLEEFFSESDFQVIKKLIELFLFVICIQNLFHLILFYYSKLIPLVSDRIFIPSSYFLWKSVVDFLCSFNSFFQENDFEWIDIGQEYDFTISCLIAKSKSNFETFSIKSVNKSLSSQS